MTAVINGHDIGREAGRAAPGDSDSSQQRNAEFPRSASYTFMPSLATSQAYNRKPPVPITIKGSFSEEDLIAPTDDSADVSPPESSGWTTPSDELRMHTDSAKDLVAELHKSHKISLSRLADNIQDETNTRLNQSSARVSPTVSIAHAASTAAPAQAEPLVSTDRLQASFAKRLSRRLSSTPSSRDPSPSKSSKRNSFIKNDSQDEEAAPTPPPIGSVDRKRTVLRKRDSTYAPKENKHISKENKNEPKESRPNPGLLSRSSTMLRRKSFKAAKSPKPEEPTIRASMEISKSVPPVPNLPKSFSTDRLPSSSQTHHDRSIPVPRIVSGEKISGLGALSLPRKRDDLWSIFRALDGDYTKCVTPNLYQSQLHTNHA